LEISNESTNEVHRYDSDCGCRHIASRYIVFKQHGQQLRYDGEGLDRLNRRQDHHFSRRIDRRVLPGLEHQPFEAG
jgi:hypothetical protein